jgi:hypothetical protein
MASFFALPYRAAGKGPADDACGWASATTAPMCLPASEAARRVNRRRRQRQTFPSAKDLSLRSHCHRRQVAPPHRPPKKLDPQDAAAPSHLPML